MLTRVCIKLDGTFNSVESVPRARSDDQRYLLVLANAMRHDVAAARMAPMPPFQTSLKRSPRCHDKLPSDFVERDTLTPCE